MKKQIILLLIGILAKTRVLSPIKIAKLKFWYTTHHWPNFDNPRDINEKINWMKFYGDTSLWPLLADKYRVREYVKECGLEDSLVPIIGKWDSVDDIDWNILPQQFVMKCNNGSGDVIICKDKKSLNIEETKKHFKKCLNKKFGSLSGEPHYAHIKTCIIAEKLLDASTQPCNSSSLVDYKIWVFDGKPMFVWCTWNREGYHANVALFDMNWEFHPEWSVWTNHYIKPEKLIPKPECFNQLIEIAGRLSKGLPAARIDLYVINNHVYFGEITMTSNAGYMNFYTQSFLNKLGDLTVLPIDKR